MPTRPLPIVMASAIFGLLIGAAKPATPLVVRGDGLVNAIVGGVPGRLRLTPWAPAAPTLNPDYVARIGLKPGWIGFSVKVGPVKVSGRTAVTRLQYRDFDGKRRVVWFERRYEAGADGAIGPGGLRADTVRFELRAPTARERSVALPLVQNFAGPAFARLRVGDRDVMVLFDPQHAQTLATAGAGTTLASALGGELAGSPRQAEVAFGIERPIRTLRLARPLALGPVALDSVAVRIGDSGSVSTIADADADPDEVVVTAKGGGKRRDVLIVGADALARCSSITFDKRAKTITLSCAA